MKINIIITLLFMCSVGVWAQNSSIEGKITQVDGVTPLVGVSVRLEKINMGTSTNGSGYYVLENIPAGEYTLVFSSIGYHPIKKFVKVENNVNLTLNFSLIEAIATFSEISITGGKKGIRDIPGSVHYVSPKEIEKFSYTDVNRVLRAVPGVNIQEEDGFGLFPSIGLRGTGVERNTKITVMEDGVLIAPAPYAAPAAYYFPTMGRMQGVEVVKGSSQIKYGPYTTGGAMNLISAQIPEEFSGKFTLLGGSFGNRTAQATVGNSHKNFAYVVETYQYGSDGFKQLDGAENRGFDKNSGFKKEDYLAKFRVNTNPDAKIYQSLTFKIGQAKGDINETYLGLTQEDFDENPYRRYAGSQVDNIQTLQNQLSLTHNIKLSKKINVTTVAYKTTFKRNWYKLDQVKDDSGTKTKIGTLLDNPSLYNNAYEIVTGADSALDDALFVKANNRKYYSKGIQSKVNFNFIGDNVKHNIDVGIRVHQDQIDRFQWVDEYAMENGVMELTKAGEYGTESNRVETANAFATYVQYQLKFGKMTLTPGIRYENITQEREDYGKNDTDRTGTDLSIRSNTVNVLLPGIGIDYKHSNNLSYFVGIHKGFAPPGSKDELEPEESINYEIGSRFSKKGLSGQAVLFFNDYKNLLGADLEAAGGGGTNEQFNGGAVQTKGLEFDITYDLLYANSKGQLSLPVSLVYTYTDAQFLNSFDSDFDGWGEVAAGDQFPYLAKNQISLIVGLEHHKYNFNLSGKYLDAMRTLPGQGTIPLNEKTDAYFVVDASAGYALNKNISLFANVTNFTNQTYVVARRPAGLRPGLPRAFNFGIKSTF